MSLGMPNGIGNSQCCYAFPLRSGITQIPQRTTLYAKVKDKVKLCHTRSKPTLGNAKSSIFLFNDSGDCPAKLIKKLAWAILTPISVEQFSTNIQYYGTPVYGHAFLGYPSTWECIPVYWCTPLDGNAFPYLGIPSYPSFDCRSCSER